MMKIAIIGSGISGLTCAYLLSRKHDVHVFEANDYVGGHTHTVDVRVASGNYAIDTGFIVFNDWTYPNFIKLMNQIGVKWQDSAMSFSVKTEAEGLEYNGNSINTLFAQRLNFFRPSFYRMVKDILRFNKESPKVLTTKTAQTLSEYLKEHGYSESFKKNYIIPMGAAIWSSSAEQIEAFPIEYFVRFFKNHGMLSVDERPIWKVIQKGSRSYIKPLTKSFASQIYLNSEVTEVKRNETSVKITSKRDGKLIEQDFDHVVLSGHSNQSLKILSDVSATEKEVLSGFEYQVNDTVLHTDTDVLPRKKLAWAAWNYFLPKEKSGKVSVSYNMNILQGIQAPETFCVSLNSEDQIHPSKVLAKFQYEHPVYSKKAFEMQNRFESISGLKRTHFCGAYWGYGFHEDGVKSALRVAQFFGESL